MWEAVAVFRPQTFPPTQKVAHILSSLFVAFSDEHKEDVSTTNSLSPVFLNHAYVNYGLLDFYATKLRKREIIAPLVRCD